MKKILTLSAVLCIFLTSCGNLEINKRNNEAKYNITEDVNKDRMDTIKENSKDDEVKNEDILGIDLDLLKDNPIDNDYWIEYRILNQSRNYTDKAVEKLRRKYYEIWDNELNVIYNKLLDVLEEEEKELLIESQKGWLQLHLIEPKFFSHTLKSRDAEERLREIAGMQLEYIQKKRIRRRTLQLIQYYHMLGNEIKFDYKKQFEYKEEEDNKLDDCGYKVHKLYVHYDNEGRYYQTSYDNPIDHDYDRELEKLNDSSDYSTHKVLQFQFKYNDIWDKELNDIYNKFVKELNEEEKELLFKAQLGWVQFHMNEDKFYQKTFCESESGSLLGEISKIQMVDACMERIKKRTLELIEYYYYFGKCGVEFEYKSQL
ncbi:lysozyme inhibitor LprI family protein [Oceanirhabdus sp. W0125-5]|uniref:lysozyme inhibitor LprI family protein n=1 Tax=Oceanirhabdus sp. W0125-5 TaxID=2999116 RepID=UPI0022F2DE9B|nr:lysozyme inhibitor LprI family protein [Oceanirhabdus sp. W0125-5]WBW96948.1 lysozyme inhibitor LprI family protein [Oceanirhabdus sp. W0125-5]